MLFKLSVFFLKLLMFCEGTRFSEQKLIESNKFAAKNNLPQLKHTLVPRTKGFVLTMEGIKEKCIKLL